MWKELAAHSQLDFSESFLWLAQYTLYFFWFKKTHVVCTVHFNAYEFLCTLYCMVFFFLLDLLRCNWQNYKYFKSTLRWFNIHCERIPPIWWINTSITSHIFYFFKTDLYWSIIASQYCVSFGCTTKWISHMSTRVPIPPPYWASLPSSLSHPSRSSQSTEPISLCYAAASHQPTVFHSVVYICRCYSHFVPAYTCPSPCPQIHSLRLHLYSCPAPRFFRPFFFFRDRKSVV